MNTMEEAESSLDEICRRVENRLRLEEILARASWEYYTGINFRDTYTPRHYINSTDATEKPAEPQDAGCN